MNKRYESSYWELLTELQNGYFPHIDIMTITGFMDDKEFVKHVSHYAAKAWPERYGYK